MIRTQPHCCNVAMVVAAWLAISVFPYSDCIAIAQEAPAPLYKRLLFIGNSHTTQHNIPRTVAELIKAEKNSGGKRPFIKTMAGENLESFERRVGKSIFVDGKWDVVVLQGQKISVSGKYNYSTDEAVKIAEMAIDSGARVIWFSEWGWQADKDPTNRIQDVYQKIQEKVVGKTTLAPVGLAWKTFSASNQQPLHSLDGNHSNPAGAFLSALVLYQVITGNDCRKLPTIKVRQVDAELQTELKKAASTTVKRFKDKT